MRTMEISCSAIHTHYENFPEAMHYRRFCTQDWLADWKEFYCGQHLGGYALEISAPKIRVNSRVVKVTLFGVTEMRPTIRIYFTPDQPGNTSHIDINMLHCRPIYLRNDEILLLMRNHGTVTLRPYVSAELPPTPYPDVM